MSRTSCDDGWCDQCSQCSGYMIERNSCQVQVSEHSPGPSSVKSAVFGFYVLGFPYFRSHGGDRSYVRGGAGVRWWRNVDTRSKWWLLSTIS